MILANLVYYLCLLIYTFPIALIFGYIFYEMFNEYK